MRKDKLRFESLHRYNILKVATVKEVRTEIVKRSKEKIQKMQSQMTAVVFEERAMSVQKVEIKIKN